MTDFVTGTAGLGHSLQSSAGRVSVPGGACIWLTGLSGAGKSTTAQLVAAMLESGGRCVTLLDGDVVRELLSPDLGFSRSDRDANVRRIGFVAREIVRHGGVAVCAAISPYRATRAEVRAMVGPCRFVEVYVDCPLEVCEARDPKGLYAQARAGLIPAFTGISAPYEPPERAEVVISTASTTVQANAIVLLRYLASTGLLVGSVLDDGSPLPIPSSSQVDDTDRRSSNDQRIPMR